MQYATLDVRCSLMTLKMHLRLKAVNIFIWLYVCMFAYRLMWLQDIYRVEERTQLEHIAACCLPVCLVGDEQKTTKRLRLMYGASSSYNF